MKYDRSKSDQLTQRRREQIIEAAERSFRKRGFHATTLREIAAEFGMSVGHIYNYFSGKDAILEALINESVLRILKASRQRMAEYIVDLVRKDGDRSEWTSEHAELIRHRVIATLAMLEGLHLAVLFDDVDADVLREVVIDRLLSLREIEKELDKKRQSAA